MSEPRAVLASRMGLIVGLQGLRARPLRTALAGLSLLLGVVAVICVQASSRVAERAVTARVEITEGRAPTFAVDVPAQRRALEAAQEVRSGISSLSTPRSTLVLTVRGDGGIGVGSEVVPLRIVAVEGDLREIRPFPVRAGTWLSQTSGTGLAPDVVLNVAAAARLDGRAIEPRLRIGASSDHPRPLIIGVVDDGENEPNAYVHLAQALRWNPALAEATQTSILVHEDPTGPSIRAAVSAGLAAREISTEPFRRVDQTPSLQASVAAVQRIFIVIAGVALVVGVVSILNIGLATIGERVDELALRRAVGTTRTQLAAIVLVDAVLVGALAAALAVSLSVLLLVPVTRSLFPDLPTGEVDFPTNAALFGIAASCGAAVLGGLIPALRAARIPIASVMRA